MGWRLVSGAGCLEPWGWVHGWGQKRLDAGRVPSDGCSAEPLFWGCVTHPFLSVLYFLLSAFPLDAKLWDYWAQMFTVEMADMNRQILKCRKEFERETGWPFLSLWFPVKQWLPFNFGANSPQTENGTLHFGELKNYLGNKLWEISFMVCLTCPWSSIWLSGNFTQQKWATFFSFPGPSGWRGRPRSFREGEKNQKKWKKRLYSLLGPGWRWGRGSFELDQRKVLCLFVFMYF